MYTVKTTHAPITTHFQSNAVVDTMSVAPGPRRGPGLRTSVVVVVTVLMTVMIVVVVVMMMIVVM
jgi:hypothetical protein